MRGVLAMRSSSLFLMHRVPSGDCICAVVQPFDTFLSSPTATADQAMKKTEKSRPRVFVALMWRVMTNSSLQLIVAANIARLPELLRKQ